MQLIPSDTKIDFLKRARLCAFMSAGAILISAVMWFVWGGFQLGIEFAGGTLVQVAFPDVDPGSMTTGRIRTAMADLGYPDAVVVSFGDASENSFQISVKTSEEEAATGSATARPGEAKAAEVGKLPAVSAADPESSETSQAAAESESSQGPEGESAEAPAAGVDPAATPGSAMAGTGDSSLVGRLIAGLSRELGAQLEVERVESIGPRVGDELTRSGFLAVFIVGFLILLYIWLRFDLRYAPGAVLALLHDVTITAGFFVVFQLEFNLQVLAALLVVLGYSLNDTIVVYDRIRENVELRGTTQLIDVVNQSVNQTLSRSLLTSATTLLVVLALLLLGGPVLRDFAVALMVGIVVGTYSSIYVASALLVAIHQRWQTAS